MFTIESLEDILALKEDYEVEFKKATGKNGKGKLPNDLLESYVAMANTEGGNIFLGMEETSEGIKLAGIKEPDRVVKELFDMLNNHQKVSKNILTNDNVEILEFEKNYVIWIKIPRATRKQRPIYKGQNPLTGTFVRQGEGDYKCSKECVKRFLAEQIEESRDNRILKNFGLQDIDMDSFYAYRNIFKSHKPDHPFNALSDIEFLRSIGGYRKDRESGEEGLTVAGLLMFGKWNSIEDVFPYYMIDYQERDKAKAEKRWIDRVVPDGSWSGNIFDFYRKVIIKLYDNLKVPFKLQDAKREEDTPVHQALREALINTLVHADYSERLSILVVKRPDMYGFRNPGLMRIPVELAIRGGESDCRNRNLQKMFMLIGYAEKAGSGIPKIFQGWNSQQWTKPLLYEKRDPHPQTLLELRMINLYGKEIIDEMKSIMGSKIETLNKEDLLIIATAYAEEEVNHKRLTELLDLHPSDISNILKSLVERGYLTKKGTGRGSVYKLSISTGGVAASTGGVAASTGGVAASTGGVAASTGGVARFYRPEEIPPEILEHIKEITSSIQNKQRVGKEQMKQLILQICEYGYFSQELLSTLLGRHKDTIKKYIAELIDAKKIFPYFASQNSPKQAYTSKKE